jgi:ATP:ADP antiporter, AAA family
VPSIAGNSLRMPVQSLGNIGDRLHRLIGRAVEVEGREVKGLLVSFAYFFCVLCAYYIIRPVRDDMGVAVGPEGLKQLFTVVFFVMLGAVPVFGWVVARFARRMIVPVIYAFFIACLLVFWLALRSGVNSAWLGGTFFVWTSVFNLFIVSLFWSLMSDLYRTDQAKRLYGFIAAGGSAGAFSGPLVTQTLVQWVGPSNLLLVSAMFLAFALAASLMLRQLFKGVSGGRADERPIGEGVFSGAVRVWESPLLFRIAMWVLLANVVSTLFYLEQSRIVGETLTDRTARVLLFSRIDLAVNVLTLATQVFLTSRVLQTFGMSGAGGVGRLADAGRHRDRNGG